MADTTVDLVTIDELKAHLSVSADTWDTQFANWITAFSLWANRYTNRYLLSKAHTEYYDGDGDTELFLANYPVTAITSIHIDTDHAYGADTAVDSSDILLYASSGRVVLKTGTFTVGPKSVKVVYTAGWEVASVPLDLKVAMYEQIKEKWLRWQKNSEGLEREPLPEGGDRSFATSDLLMSVVRVFNAYSRRGHFGAVG